MLTISSTLDSSYILMPTISH